MSDRQEVDELREKIEKLHERYFKVQDENRHLRAERSTLLDKIEYWKDATLKRP